MSTTKTTTVRVTKTDVMGLETLSYMRPIVVFWSATNLKPGAKMYAFFDGVPVNEYIRPYGDGGGQLVANIETSGTNAGKVTSIAIIDAGTYSTPPTLTFSGGTGTVTLPAATAILSSAGIIEGAYSNTPAEFLGDKKFIASCTITGSGSGYTSAPKITLSGNKMGDDLIVDANGNLSGYFYIPAGRFNTGSKLLRLQDSPTLIEIPGSNVVFAEMNYTSTGIKKTLQDTITSKITNVTTTWQYPVDPLAQSFFTYGVTGGCFITSIDLWFQSKDAGVPVSVEIRELVNGLPGAVALEPDAICLKDPSEVTIATAGDLASEASSIMDFTSSTAIPLATNFKFKKPIYLKENGDYCFVIKSNSNNYHVYTSRMGEKSLENGRVVFDQPYVGSMFKSENNKTWTAEQYEDIKCRINKAKFDITKTTNVQLTTNPAPIKVSGSVFTTTSGSSLIRVKLKRQHAFDVSSKVVIVAPPNAVLNGISSDNLTGTFNVESVIDEFTFTFNASANATSTGPINNAGRITGVQMLSQGSGYSGTPTVNFLGAGGTWSGSGANAKAIVTTDGRISGIEVLYTGVGLTGAPSITISGTGSGASAQATTEPIFMMYTNKVAHAIYPVLDLLTPQGTSADAFARMSSGNYIGGSLTPYVVGSEMPLSLFDYSEYGTHNWMASRINESVRMANAQSMSMRLALQSSNENVSPVFDLRNVPRLRTAAYGVSNQSGETLTATAAAGSIASITMSSVGSGYTSDPVVKLIDPLGLVADVTLTPTRVGGQITSISLPTPNNAVYRAVPSITITGGGFTTTATAQCALTPFNTEYGDGGSALSRYVTGQIGLATVSKGVRVYATLSSTVNSSVDVYIKTSLAGSGTVHSSQPWRLLSCDEPRNKSSSRTQFFEYMFYLNSIPAFDIYSLKLVLRGSFPADPPIMKNYRAIILA